MAFHSSINTFQAKLKFWQTFSHIKNSAFPHTYQIIRKCIC